MPTSNFQPVRLLDPINCSKFINLMTNSADPDQLASSEANWSGSTLFAKQSISGFSRTRVNLSPQSSWSGIFHILDLDKTIVANRGVSHFWQLNGKHCSSNELTCYQPSHSDLRYLHKYLFWSTRLKGLKQLFYPIPILKENSSVN